MENMELNVYKNLNNWIEIYTVQEAEHNPLLNSLNILKSSWCWDYSGIYSIQIHNQGGFFCKPEFVVILHQGDSIDLEDVDCRDQNERLLSEKEKDRAVANRLDLLIRLVNLGKIVSYYRSRNDRIVNCQGFE